MPANQLLSEILSISGIPDYVGNIEAIVGDVLSFAPQAGVVGTLTTTLTRKPGGSSATVVSNGVTFDVAGLFNVTVLNGGVTRNINVFVFPVSVLSVARAPFVPPGNTQIAKVGRQHLRALVQDSRCVLANMAASLEAATPTWFGMLGSGVQWSWDLLGVGP